MAINAKDRTKNPMPALVSSLSVNTKPITRTIVKIITKQAMKTEIAGWSNILPCVSPNNSA